MAPGTRYRRTSSVALATAAAALSLATSSESSVKAQKSAHEHIKKGEKALAAREFEKAETELRAALADDPEQAKAYLGLGTTYMATKRYSEALEAFLRCKLALEDSLANRLRTEASDSARREDRIRYLQDTLRALQTGQARTDNVERAVALVETELRELEAARQRDVAGHDAVPAPLWLSIGSAHFRLGHQDDARSAFERALLGDPRLGEAHNNLAVLHMLGGRLDAAESELRAAEENGFAVNPKFKEELAARRASGAAGSGMGR